MNTITNTLISTTMTAVTKLSVPLALGTLWLLAAACPATAQDAEAQGIMEQSHLAYYYAGDGGHARVHMTLVDKKGKTREREFWMLRRDVEQMGDQRYYTYFLKPADVSRTAFLVHKKTEGNDDRWLYVPALDLVKRIAANDRGSSFMGSDFSYEDVSGRLPALDHHEILGQDTVMDRPVTKIKSTPKDPKTADYQYRVSWIDRETFLPLKEEYFDDKNAPVRRFEIQKVEEVEGIPTAVQRTMTTIAKGSQTLLTFSDLTYVPRLEADDYNERLLKSPPAEYTR